MFIVRRNEKSTLILYKGCEELKQEFLNLKTSRDVARLLEVSYDRLIYHLYRVPKESRYVEFSVPKKSGGFRTISAPSSGLKILQRKLSQVLYSVYEPKATIHGFVPGRSIITNAERHLHKRFVLNIDLLDFFGSIHFGRVRGVFLAPPYNCTQEVSTTLAQICCHNNKLPQGAPTSPVITNMVCARMDTKLRSLAQDLKCTYTRYADDITFSTSLRRFPEEIAYVKSDEGNFEIVLGERLISIIQGNSFEINQKKVRLQHKSQHQEVTGITVNQIPNVRRSFVREISSMLHIWEKFGIENAEKRYVCKRSKELGLPTEDAASFREVLRGKINFLGMVKGKNNKTYRTYLSWYCKLANQ